MTAPITRLRGVVIHTAAKLKILAAWPEGKLPTVIATLKRMEPIDSAADEGWVVMGPSLGPVAATNITQANAELIGYDQADARYQNHFVPA